MKKCFFILSAVVVFFCMKGMEEKKVAFNANGDPIDWIAYKNCYFDWYGPGSIYGTKEQWEALKQGII